MSMKGADPPDGQDDPGLAVADTMVSDEGGAAEAETLPAGAVGQPSAGEPVSSGDGSDDLIAAATPDDRPRRERQFERGDTLGRFTVLEQIGRGGMGVVLAAYDSKLDRKVAIKLLRPDTLPMITRLAHQRLQREAQAMARLSHPNVITVHEVDEVGDRVFLAMEFVDGGTLKHWLGAEERSTRDIMDVFIQAGEGLAAAHGAGLVHRDFKPENVLIGSDRRVRVTDFGLVGTADDAPRPSQPRRPRPPARSRPSPASSSGSSPGASSTPLNISLTHTGALMGTPGYMAPEQYEGKPAGFQADQFAFCVALFEALYGMKPFAGRSYDEIAENVLDGNVQDTSRCCREVPPHVRRLLLRGLSVAPDDRFPSMRALLDELTRDRAGNKKRLVVALAALIMGGAAVAGLWGSPDEPDLCQGGARKLDRVWSDANKQALRVALTADQPYATAAYDRVVTLLDEYAASWSAMYTEACEATHVHGEQSEALLDLRMRCLDQRLEDMRSRVAVIGEGSAPERAVSAVAYLPGVDQCADVEALTSVIPLPANEQTRRMVSELAAHLTDVEGLRQLGKHARALEHAEHIVVDAAALGYRPLEARALAVLAELKIDMKDHEGDTLQRAIQAAAEARDDELLARVLITRMEVVALHQERSDVALEMAIVTEAMIGRVKHNTRMLARFHHILGKILARRGKHQAAFERLEQALDLLQSEPEPSELALAEIETSLGRVAWKLGRLDEARLHFQRVMDTRGKALGAQHPDVADALHTLGIMSMEAGQLDEARRHLEQALEIREVALGASHQDVGMALGRLGAIAHLRGSYDDAIRYAKRGLAISRRAFGPDHPALVKLLITLGDGHRAKGLSDAAQAHYERAIEILDRVADRDPHDVVTAVHHLGQVLLDRGALDAATEQFERAARAATTLPGVELGGPEPAELAGPLLGLGAVHLARGEPDLAVETIERALSIRERLAVPVRQRAEARFALARALWLLRGRRADARRAADQARTEFVSAGDTSAAGQVAAWLGSH